MLDNIEVLKEICIFLFLLFVLCWGDVSGFVGVTEKKERDLDLNEE